MDGAADPPEAAGGQGVHGDDAGGAEGFGHGADKLAALHAGGAQYPGGQGGHRPEGAEVLRHPFHQVAGHHGLVGSLGADVVGGDGPVAQAHHQGGRARRQAQQRPQLRRQGPRRPAEGVLLPAGQAVQLQGHIGAHRLAQGPGARLVPDAHGGHRIALPRRLLRLHARQRPGLPGALLPELGGLQSQVGSPFQHIRPSIPQDVVLMTPDAPIFCAERLHMQKK